MNTAGKCRPMASEAHILMGKDSQENILNKKIKSMLEGNKAIKKLNVQYYKGWWVCYGRREHEEERGIAVFSRVGRMSLIK